MFVIELTYKAPLTEIDAHMAEHVAFLKKYQHKLSDFRIIQFRASQRAADAGPRSRPGLELGYRPKRATEIADAVRRLKAIPRG